MTNNNLCSSCTNIGCEFQSGIVRTKCAFYMPLHIAKDEAIDIIRKYQKIEQILDDCDLEAWEVLEKIKQVMIKADEAESEDGK